MNTHTITTAKGGMKNRQQQEHTRGLKSSTMENELATNLDLRCSVIQCSTHTLSHQESMSCKITNLDHEHNRESSQEHSDNE